MFLFANELQEAAMSISNLQATLSALQENVRAKRQQLQNNKTKKTKLQDTIASIKKNITDEKKKQELFVEELSEKKEKLQQLQAKTESLKQTADKSKDELLHAIGIYKDQERNIMKVICVGAYVYVI